MQISPASHSGIAARTPTRFKRGVLLHKRIMAIVLAVVAALGLNLTSASASPGHVTIGCGVGTSTGWTNVYLSGDYVGKACFSIYDDGSHVDVTYWVYDGSADGWDIDGYRLLNWDPTYTWAKVCSASGHGTYGSANKMYDDDPGSGQAITMRVTADKNGTTYTLGTIGPLYF